jgi:hypothetical protein
MMAGSTVIDDSYYVLWNSVRFLSGGANPSDCRGVEELVASTVEVWDSCDIACVWFEAT